MTIITTESREAGSPGWLVINRLIANDRDALKLARQEAELRLTRWRAVDQDGEYRIREQK